MARQSALTDFTEWLTAYGDAWEAGDAASAAALFTVGATVSPGPFDELLRGRRAIQMHLSEMFGRVSGASFSAQVLGAGIMLSGVLALLCHLAFEPSAALSPGDWGLIVAVGLGPLGAAFYLWDAALKRGDARRIGILSYLTPLASTLLLVALTGRPLTVWVGGAALLIIGAAIVGVRAR